MFYTKEKIDTIMQTNQVTVLEDQLKTMELIKGLQDCLKIQSELNEALRKRIEKLEEK